MKTKVCKSWCYFHLLPTRLFACARPWVQESGKKIAKKSPDNSVIQNTLCKSPKLVCVCVSECVCVHAHACVSIYVCGCVCECVGVSECACVHTYVCVHICVPMLAHTFKA